MKGFKGHDTPPPPGNPKPEAPEPESRAPTSERLSVVGVGASAGGLEAFSQLLHALRSDTNMAFVLVQHLAPRHPSMMADLLARTTRMPVLQVTDGMPLKANHVYVIPPNVAMEILDGKLHLSPRPSDSGQFMPIDFFFRSLADYCGQDAIGIILSGTASDGALGLREIKAVGGITMAQDPKTAKYDGMPRSAIARGLVDLVLAPEQMAETLARIAEHPLLRHLQPRRPGDQIEVVDDHFLRILVLLRSHAGVDFTHYKQATIKRRVQRRMVVNKLSSAEAYIRYLQRNPVEIQNLFHDLLIQVTRFFREPESFKVLAEEVLPAIVQDRPESPVRIWIPGCSTGEEVYSIIIALLEYLGDQANQTPIQVFGTDISEHAIQHARSGFYPESIAADVSPERLRRFFIKMDGGYKVQKAVRDLCVFARQDLTRDPPFSKLDLIICRNVLIYLDAVLQRRLLSVFHYALKPSGFLILGSAETVGPHAELFTLSNKRFKVYTKKTVLLRPPPGFGLEQQTAGRGAPAPKAPPQESGGEADLQSQASRFILSRYSPPGVIVDSDWQIIQFRGQTGDYLEPAPGDPSMNLLKMAREGLLHPLRSALNEARKTQKSTHKKDVHVKVRGETREVTLEVVPLAGSRERCYFLVLFKDQATEGPEKKQVPARPREKQGVRESRGKDATVERLQEELAASREYLQSIIQDLEAANEELQSANEEILSSNEELQSTNEELDTAKEELQSTNEEINTVNEELNSRNDEMSRVNSDLINLLGSVQIAIVMVSGDLRIRRFTPMAERVLNLIPTDIGRPFSDIKPSFHCPDLEKQITEAIDSMATKELEVKDDQGRWFSLRIRPYKNVENRIDGAILSLFDISESKERLDRSEEARRLAEAMVQMVSQPLAVLSEDLHLEVVNQAFCDLLKKARSDVEGKSIYQLSDGQWDSPALRGMLEDALPREGKMEGFRLDQSRQDGKSRALVLKAKRLEILRELHVLLAVEETQDDGGPQEAHHG